jgi:hypothetical protein
MRRKQIGPRIRALDAELAGVQATYDEWHAELEEQRQQVLLEPGMDWWKAMEVVNQRYGQALQEGTSPIDFQHLIKLLDELCALYLKADEQQRVAVRAIFDDKSSVLRYLHTYIGFAARHLAETNDKKWLRMGLAAASMCDCRVDWRDLMIRLGDLYLTAKEAGFRPGYQFTAVARLSNRSRRYKQNSTRDFLANFRKSAYLGSLLRQPWSQMRHPEA